mmetsp:Transcript_53133/g.124327  ORF Transcript_53133/g.124327 Transcript_53133/m.124327 type:complete len:228 (+) Transcript_53133:1166-1849(+)
MRARLMPWDTVMPGRTINSCTSPPVGACTLESACTCPLCSTCWIRDVGMPSSTKRWRAAAVRAASPVWRTARNSCWAPAHSGTSSSAMKAPLATTSPGARRATRWTKPAVRACRMATSRSLSCTTAGTWNEAPSRCFSTVAVRTPRVWATRGSTATPPEGASSAYLGTSCMSMNGDLPGLSNFCCGTMGSYQYRALRSPAGLLVVSLVPDTVADGSDIEAVRQWATP